MTSKSTDGRNTIMDQKSMNQKLVTLKEWMTSSTYCQPPILVLNGGVSTYLEKIVGGTKPFRHRELWSSSILLERNGEDAIRTCHSDFYSAGSNIITTVTYQLSHYCCYDHKGLNRIEQRTGGEMDSAPLHLHLSENDVDTLLQKAVQLALDTRDTFIRERRANQTTFISTCSHHLFVVASIGCYGAALANGAEYTGTYFSSANDTSSKVHVEDLVQFHERRYLVFSQGINTSRLDGIAFETIPCLDEVEAICRLLYHQRQQRVQSESEDTLDSTAVWISFSCKDGEHLNDGTHVQHALDRIEHWDPEGTFIHGIGVNCFHIHYLSSLVNILAKHISSHTSHRALVFYPNSGEEWDSALCTWKKGTGCTDPSEFSKAILTNGVMSLHQYVGRIPIIVGGCCRCNPNTIRELRKDVDEYCATGLAPNIK